MGKGGGVNFIDLYPEYDCVTIIGCNELAWYFAKYLIHIGVNVNVEGELWKDLGNWKCYNVIDHKNLIIYAEGTWNKERNMLHYILRSVSVEFEYIDRIYEENLKKGWIKDTDGDFNVLVTKLHQENEIVIVGTDQKSQDAYDLLLGKGIDIFCFFSSDIKECEYTLLGKPIMDMKQVAGTLSHPYFIECTLRHSAWGTLETVDAFAYMGYQRNEQFIYLQDYIDIPENQLRNILRGKDVVCIGNPILCHKLVKFFNGGNVKNVRYGGNLEERINVKRDEICLFASPEYFPTEQYNKDLCRKVKNCIANNNLSIYTNYFSNTKLFLSIDNNRVKYTISRLKPKGILLGAMKARCGNIFFRDIIEGHPNILKMPYSFLNDNLFFICSMLAEVRAENILNEFWNKYKLMQSSDTQKELFPKPDIFLKKMKEMLAEKDFFTSQELFIIFHIAYAQMCSGINNMDIGQFVIYWEPHNMNRTITKIYAKWLSDKNIKGFTIDIVRNACVRAGAGLKSCFAQRQQGWHNIWNSSFLEEEEKYTDWEQLDIRFEDLKCKPCDILPSICNKLGIPWADNLLKTTPELSKQFGISDVFDLKSVFNDYAEYLTSYDRMRISMINCLFQKKYGYSYVSYSLFTKKDLQEMFLKEFYFEKMYSYTDEETRIIGRLYVKRHALVCLRRARMAELINENLVY